MTQPTKPSQPSAGVLRAAEIIGYIRIQAPHGDRHQLLELVPILRDGMPSDYTMASTMAHIIDRETGVAELLEAAKDVCWFDWSLNDEDAVRSVNRLQQAIAKCGGSERDEPTTTD